MAFSFEDLENLKKIISPDDDDDHYSGPIGSTLTPASMTGGRKESAPAHSKITAKVNRKNPNEIWKEEETNNLAQKLSDDRPEPNYEILYKQKVGTEDVFLGIGGLDPSSRCCQDLLIKISLPETRQPDISLDVQSNVLKLQAPKFILTLPLPHQVDDKKGNAKWDGDKKVLSVTLPIVQEFPIM
jgi:hypothetical protein